MVQSFITLIQNLYRVIIYYQPDKQFIRNLKIKNYPYNSFVLQVLNPAPRAVKSIENKRIELGAGFGVGYENLTHTLHQLYNQ